MYRLFWCGLNIAVCKSCSLACIECPICRTKIVDRIFAFTWLCTSIAWNDGAKKGSTPHESHFTFTSVHTYILKNVSYCLLFTYIMKYISYCLLFTAGVHLFSSTCHILLYSFISSTVCKFPATLFKCYIIFTMYLTKDYQRKRQSNRGSDAN